MKKVKEFLTMNVAAIIAAISVGLIAILLITMCSLSFSLHSVGMWLILVLCATIFVIASLYSDNHGIAAVVFIILVAEIIYVLFFGSAIISTEPYKNMVQVNETDFSFVEKFNQKNVQVVDKDSAVQIGDRIFGQLGEEFVSQFKPGDYDQIVYQGALYRIAPVEFRGVFSYFTNKTAPGYILVNCETGDASFVESEIAYNTSAWFKHNVYRNNWLGGITQIYGTSIFEIDEDGNPYWVTPIISYKNVGKQKNVIGVRLLNAVTGEATVYGIADVPVWVDNIYSTSVAYYRFNSQKRYSNGFWNFARKGVVEYTEDYAYLQMNNHLYFYTGVTSVGKDESNVGFAYVDLRTNEVIYIAEAGAEEFSARSSAEGAIQEKGYLATFPTMVNIDGEPTYFMSLKDKAGLIKAYAFVSYRDYQKVGVGNSVDDALKAYQKGNTVIDKTDTKEVSFEVSEVEVITVNGNSVVVFLDIEGNIHSYSVEEDGYNTLFAKAGDIFSVEETSDGKILKIH